VWERQSVPKKQALLEANPRSGVGFSVRALLPGSKRGGLPCSYNGAFLAVYLAFPHLGGYGRRGRNRRDSGPGTAPGTRRGEGPWGQA
jgi:hypothetical protein